MVRAGRQDNAKHRASAGFSIKFEATAVFVNYSSGDSQAQAGAVAFGAEKRLEYFFLEFDGDAGAGVLDFDDRDLGGLSGPVFSSCFCAQGDGAAAGRETFGSVLDQMDEHLCDLGKVGAEAQAVVAIEFEFDGIVGEMRGHKVTDLSERIGRPQIGQPGLCGLGQQKKMFDDAIEALDLTANYDCVAEGIRVRGYALLESEGPGIHGGQGLLDFMYDFLGEPAKIDQFVQPGALLVELLLSVVPEDGPRLRHFAAVNLGDNQEA